MEAIKGEPDFSKSSRGAKRCHRGRPDFHQFLPRFPFLFFPFCVLFFFIFFMILLSYQLNLRFKSSLSLISIYFLSCLFLFISSPIPSLHSASFCYSSSSFSSPISLLLSPSLPPFLFHYFSPSFFILSRLFFLFS